MTNSVINKRVIEELWCDLNFIDKFSIAKLIPEDLKKQISNFYVFYDKIQGCNILFITKSDQVYGLGSNKHGCLGLGHGEAVDEPQLIQELCDKKISKFHIGTHHIFARCENHVYAWKMDSCKAKRVESLSGKRFKSMISGKFNTFGVTCDGDLYIFGNDIDKPYITKRHEFKATIRKAYQMNFLRFILLDDGRVLAWGSNVFKSLGFRSDGDFVTEGVFLELADVKDIRSTLKNTYFLKKSGYVYFCGVYYQFENGLAKIYHQCEPKELDQSRKFESMVYFDETEYILARSNEKVFKIVHDKLYETRYSSYKDYLADNFQLTLSNLNVNNPDDNNSSEELKTIATTRSHNNTDRFETQFADKIPLGEGAFGVAYKVRDKFDGKYYCIKKIDRQKALAHVRSGNIVLRETFSLVTSTMVNGSILLRYYGTWEVQNFTFLKIELMDNNLSDFVKIVRKVFKRKKFDLMKSMVEFQLHCHLFIELLSCVHELHVNRIIHRDLKLENILVNFTSSDEYCGNHIKLGDLGSSRLHQIAAKREIEQEESDSVAVRDGMNRVNLTQGIGTPGYIAPEIKSGTDYSFSADIWSLGVIAKGIFAIKNWETYKLYENNSNLCEPFGVVSETIQRMSSDDPSQRPAIPDIVNKFWSVVNTDVHFKRNLIEKIGEISRINSDADFDDLLSVCSIRVQSIES